MLSQGMKIFFAHRTFKWNNEARGNANVHCVIIGFSISDITPKLLFEYENIKGDPHLIQVKNINPFLLDAPNLLLFNIKRPICNVSPIVFGSMANEGGALLLSEEEKNELLKNEPKSEQWLKPFLGAEEFINRKPRWCLWLVDLLPSDLNALTYIKARVEMVKAHRLESKRKTTLELSKTPTLFGEIRQPKETYILIPRVSSENRNYIPCDFVDPSVICGDSCLLVPGATLYEFGIISSLMHNSWMRTVCGRLKSDYRYSAGIVYNNFPWPEKPNEKQKESIIKASKLILDTRAQFPDSTLADLYNAISMPPLLHKAHQALDKAVDISYGKTSFKSESERVSFLFELYQKITTLFPEEKSTKKKTTRKKAT